MKITVTHDDGTTQDITDAIQRLYEFVSSAVEWERDAYPDDADALSAIAAAIRHEDAEEIDAMAWRIRSQYENDKRAHAAAVKADDERAARWRAERGVDEYGRPIQ